VISNVFTGHSHLLRLEDGSCARALVSSGEDGVFRGSVDIDLARVPSAGSMGQLYEWFYDIVQMCPDGGAAIINFSDGKFLHLPFEIPPGSFSAPVEMKGLA
jgi:hypothetical protein